LDAMERSAPLDALKVCTVCKEAKGLNFFYADVRLKDGRAGMCKACRAEKRDKNLKAFDITENVPCKDCVHTFTCRSEALVCESFEKWVLNGKTNDLPRIPTMGFV